MDRRTYLARCAPVGVATALAGCTERTLEAAKDTAPWIDASVDTEEIDLPVEQASHVVAEAIERAEGETVESPDEFEAYLEDEGLAVEHLEEVEKEGETVLELEYVEGAIEEGTLRAVGLVAGGYAALVAGGYDGDELQASLLDPEGRKYGEFEVLTEWAEAYDAGEESAAVYGGDVTDTLESR